MHLGPLSAIVGRDLSIFLAPLLPQPGNPNLRVKAFTEGKVGPTETTSFLHGGDCKCYGIISWTKITSSPSVTAVNSDSSFETG